MAFGQLTHRESLSDTALCIKANSQKLYHMGIGSAISKSTAIKCDQTIKLCGFNVSKDHPIKKRRVKFYDIETNKTFVFLTNNFELKALEIATL